MKNLLGILLVVFSIASWAGDATQLRFLGFAESGHYLAFQEHGITDGEGAIFAHLYIVDVKHNKFVDDMVETQDTSGQSIPQVLKNNLQQAKAKLEKIGITIDNIGEKLISRSFNDVGVDEKNVQFAVGTPLAGLQHRTYKLTLKEKEAGLCADMGVPVQARKFSLTLLNEATHESKVLRSDVNFPENLNCPARYRIQDVYVYHDEFIVVFINGISPGYEGENMRHIVVTGTLN